MPPPPSTTPITTPIDHETAKKILPIIIMYLLDDDGEAPTPPNPEPPVSPPVQSYQWSVHYYINDHLQTPQRLLDEEGQVSWEADYEAFGKATIATDTIEQHHRFPGQYYDAESGLYYNWNRYYDSEIGRYVTSDPIGLGGGLNTFVYVDGNPLRFTDTKGLYKDLLECLMDDVASAEECFWTPDAPTVRYLKAAASAAGECIVCTISCGANFLFGTDLPLAGEAYTQAAQRSLEAAAKKKASALAAAGVKFIARRVFLPLTIASAADAAVCTAECF